MRNIFTRLSLMLLLIFSVNLWAAPAAPIVMEVRQPDGTTFSVIARGDEYASWVETMDGHTVIKEKDTWYYAGKDSLGKLISTGRKVGSLSPDELKALPLHVKPEVDPASREPYKIRNIRRDGSSSPKGPASEGAALPAAISHTQYVVTILVNYTDKALATTDATFSSLMYGASNSVKKYYLDSSYSGLTIAAATESYGAANDGVIRVSRAVVHPDQGNTYATSRDEAREIVNLADQYIDYASYDFDGNGSVSADELSIVIILAGYENSYGSDLSLTPRVWGHKSSFTNRVLDGKTLSPYTMFGEIHGTSNNPAGAHTATIGIMAHELGHLMLGLPDLYDTDQSSAGIGDWGLMGGGSWNWTGAFSAGGSATIGDSPSLLSAWSKVKTGFTVPQDIDTNTAPLTILQTATQEATKRIWIDKYKLNEYFLLENRQQTGFDTRLPSAGLLIWHIDETKLTNADESHKLVDLEEADGLAQLDSDTNDGDSGDPYRAGGVTTFNNGSNPNSKNYASNATGISVNSVSSSASSMTANIETLADGLGDHVRYDETFTGNTFGYRDLTTVWVGLRTQNNTLNTNFDGVEVYVNDPASATIDIYYYSSMTGGTPTGLVHSQTGFAAVRGWNRLLLTTPQSFPAGTERGIVLKIVNDSYTYPATFDTTATAYERSYYDFNGSGTFSPFCPNFCGELNLVALVSDDTTAPTATVITPATTGPTNANSVSFNVTFSEDVTNFNNANDVIVSHSGTASSGLSFSGSGSDYTVTVTGITGNGSFTLKANTGSDVKDTVGIALASSVTSAAVSIDNFSPRATVVTPSTLGPTNADSVSFAMIFNEDVVNFNNANDVIISHDGTANSGLNFSGSGSNYTLTVTGITGTGSFTLKANTGSDVKDVANNALGSSVTSAAVSIDNVAPDIAISSPSSASTQTGPVSYTITYTDADEITLSNDDVTLNQTGTVTGVANVTGEGTSVRTVTISGISGQGTLGISLSADSASDIAGNSSAAAGPSTTFSVVASEIIFENSFETP